MSYVRNVSKEICLINGNPCQELADVLACDGAQIKMLHQEGVSEEVTQYAVCHRHEPVAVMIDRETVLTWKRLGFVKFSRHVFKRDDVWIIFRCCDKCDAIGYKLRKHRYEDGSGVSEMCPDCLKYLHEQRRIEQEEIKRRAALRAKQKGGDA